jgi:homoserine kinase
MADILAGAADHGALGVALSGAGPTLLALVDAKSNNKMQLERFLLDTLGKHGVRAQTMWLKPSLTGAVVVPGSKADRSFMETIKGEVRA